MFGVLYQSVWVAFLFWLGALSHWLFDAAVHIRDLPVFGRKRNDIYVGLGMWTIPRVAFVFEYAFFAIVMLITAQPSAWSGLLIGGLALHLLNANSFFRFTKTNPTGTPKSYATLALVGFFGAIIWFTFTW
ncbi:MAG: hypothetical protein EOT05_01355 [Candidatus Microsaccharimonas sossegonensis]|uniref:Uncharacterized protein n=1 Tax=Candidatus Microsaccharimonas sossegonensis TaxID=2506948 RepID=A0A4Q0AGV4_9BACT|nr:MAG: hypothetical protein EOT05_01355 [Candidatus Microsaccharimonas sossegonensis]